MASIPIVVNPAVPTLTADIAQETWNQVHERFLFTAFSLRRIMLKSGILQKSFTFSISVGLVWIKAY